MRRPVLILGFLTLSGLAMGCRTPLMNPYYNMVDDINDTHIYFDRWYCPRWDVSRAGKPDWCGPVNSALYPDNCYLGRWSRYDDQNLYPPSNPYTFPSFTMPPPKVWKAPESQPTSTPAPASTKVPPGPSAETPD